MYFLDIFWFRSPHRSRAGSWIENCSYMAAARSAQGENFMKSMWTHRTRLLTGLALITAAILLSATVGTAYPQPPGNAVQKAEWNTTTYPCNPQPDVIGDPSGGGTTFSLPYDSETALPGGAQNTGSPGTNPCAPPSPTPPPPPPHPDLYFNKSVLMRPESPLAVVTIPTLPPGNSPQGSASNNYDPLQIQTLLNQVGIDFEKLSISAGGHVVGHYKDTSQIPAVNYPFTYAGGLTTSQLHTPLNPYTNLPIPGGARSVGGSFLVVGYAQPGTFDRAVLWDMRDGLNFNPMSPLQYVGNSGLPPGSGWRSARLMAVSHGDVSGDNPIAIGVATRMDGSERSLIVRVNREDLENSQIVTIGSSGGGQRVLYDTNEQLLTVGGAGAAAARAPWVCRVSENPLGCAQQAVLSPTNIGATFLRAAINEGFGSDSSVAEIAGTEKFNGQESRATYCNLTDIGGTYRCRHSDGTLSLTAQNLPTLPNGNTISEAFDINTRRNGQGQLLPGHIVGVAHGYVEGAIGEDLDYHAVIWESPGAGQPHAAHSLWSLLTPEQKQALEQANHKPQITMAIGDGGHIAFLAMKPLEQGQAAYYLYLLAPAVQARGDSNCDGEITFGDIDPFVQQLGEPSGYVQSNPLCNVRTGDTNCDGVVTFADIDPFVSFLGGSPVPCGAEP